MLKPRVAFWAVSVIVAIVLSAGAATALPVVEADVPKPDVRPITGTVRDTTGFAVDLAVETAPLPQQIEDDVVELHDQTTETLLGDGTHDTQRPAGTTPAQVGSWADLAATAWDEATIEERAAATGVLGLLVLLPFAMYSRIRRAEALENPTRRAIVEMVRSSPGVCIKDVAERVGVAHSTATYHLDRLSRDGFVVAMDTAGRRTFYPNDGSFGPDERRLAAVATNDSTMHVLRAICERAQAQRSAIAEALGVSRATVNWHLDRLEKAGLVDDLADGGPSRLTACPDALERLADVRNRTVASDAPTPASPSAPA